MIDYGYPDIFLHDAVTKDLLITDGTVNVSGDSYTVTGATVKIENNLLDSEAFELKQSLNSGQQLQFGSCESASVVFVIHDITQVLKGKTIKIYIIPNHEASKILQIGVFKVIEDELSADRTRRTITAYDALYSIINSDVAAWYNAILPNDTSSVTLAQFRTSFLNYFSITAESTTLVNDSISITRTISPETLSGADVIKAICEINGVFGMITNEGKFRYLELQADINSGLFPHDTLYPSNSLYPNDIDRDAVIEKSYYIDVQFEDYQVESITQLTIRKNDQDGGVTVGTSGNTYIITGNYLVSGLNTTALTNVANNILGKIGGRYYIPCTVNAIGNPVREIGDPLRIETKYRSVVMYMLERHLKGIQALRDTYSAQGEQYYTEQLNTVSTQLKHKVDKDTIVIDLDGKMNNSITIKPDSITFGSNGSLIVNTDNFTLDANGNAAFSGDISGATVSANGKVLAKDTNYATVVSPGGIATGMINGTETGVDTDHGIIIDSWGSITVKWGNDNVRINSDSIYINGKRVLTEDDL